MEEEWRTIEEFPSYKVSNLGRVINQETGRIIRPSLTRGDTIKIGLVGGSSQHTRSLKILVAEAFVEGHTKDCNTAIHLDGDHSNVRADNLVWRPRWFAWKYARQFAEFEPGSDRGPIREINSDVLYLDMIDAAIQNGILIHDVWRSIHLKHPTIPTWQQFEFV